MSTEQIIAVAVGCIGLPFIYWLGFDLSSKHGHQKALRELAEMKLNDDPNFEWILVNEMSKIVEERISKKAYEIK